MSLEGEGQEDDVVVDDIVDEVVEEAPQAPTMEDIASGMGWSDKDKWHGDPERWKPAHEFLKATADVNSKLTNRLKGVEDQLGRLASTSAQVTERALAKQRQELLAARDEAFDTGDRETFEKADKALAEIKVEPVVSTPPEAEDFITRNSAWWGKDQEATQWAFNRAEELTKQGISAARQISTVEREMKGLFPELFPEAPKPAKAAPLNAPGNRGAATSKKGFGALPADVQKAAMDYEKRGVCSKEEYASIYYEDQ